MYYPGASDTVGFDKMGDLLNYAVHEGVVEKSGAWYAFKGERIGQGFDKARGNMVNFEVAVRKALKEKA